VSDEHTLADELHGSVMDLSRIAYVLYALIDELEGARPHPALVPANIIVPRDDHFRLQHADALVREPPFAAPETIADGTLTVKSNIYSLGALLEAMLAGRPNAGPSARNLLPRCKNAMPDLRPGTLAAVRAALETCGWCPPSGNWGRYRERIVTRDPREVELLDLIRANPADAAGRAVYADWLEERGDQARAEFLRRDDHGPLTEADASWRAVVARAPLAGCARGGCPSRWDALAPIAGIDNLRTCRTCKYTVTYCPSLDDAEVLGHRNEPIAIDAALSPVSTRQAYDRGRPPPLTLAVNPPRPR
jgi:uncharacterized protein (TIGR02996 family)